jgi:hypothetical protein
VTEVRQSVAVQLTKGETLYAVMVGGARQSAAARQGRRNDAALRAADWQCHIEGALGELVVAKALGRYWAPNVGGYDYGADVGRFEVRATSKPDGPLIVRDRDSDAAAYVLVTGTPPCLEIRGWLYGREAKQDRYRAAPAGRPPAYFVPPGELHPFETLDDGRPF